MGVYGKIMIWKAVSIILWRKKIVYNFWCSKINPCDWFAQYFKKTQCSRDIRRTARSVLRSRVQQVWLCVVLKHASQNLLKYSLCHSASWWFYSDSLRKLNPPQRIRPKRSASVLKDSGCTLPSGCCEIQLWWMCEDGAGAQLDEHSSPLQQLFRELGRSFKSPQNHLFFSSQSLECILQQWPGMQQEGNRGQTLLALISTRTGNVFCWFFILFSVGVEIKCSRDNFSCSDSVAY